MALHDPADILLGLGRLQNLSSWQSNYLVGINSQYYVFSIKYYVFSIQKIQTQIPNIKYFILLTGRIYFKPVPVYRN